MTKCDVTQSQPGPRHTKFTLGRGVVKVKSHGSGPQLKSCPYNAMYQWLQKVPGDTIFRRTCIEHTPMHARKERNRIKSAAEERKIVSTGLDSTVSRYKGVAH